MCKNSKISGLLGPLERIWRGSTRFYFMVVSNKARPETRSFGILKISRIPNIYTSRGEMGEIWVKSDVTLIIYHCRANK